MANESGSNNTEIEVDDENIYISRKFSSNHSLSSWAEDNLHDDDPYHNDDTLDNKCRNGSFKKSEFCDSPELEMPAVNEGPEDERRAHRSKGEGWAQAEG